VSRYSQIEPGSHVNISTTSSYLQYSDQSFLFSMHAVWLSQSSSSDVQWNPIGQL